jgi:phospholipid/cholesterol/gamma-HCH transport system substrate-binding protein
MEPEAKYTLVGTSVLVLLALVTAAVVWLASSGQGTDVQRYKIYFARQSLEGLDVRSDVRMKGIRVGAVTGFSFSTQRPGTVEVVVGIDPATPVKESTRAVVDRNLVTGLATIRLQNVTEDSPAVKRPAPGERDAVIAEGASQLQQFSETVNDLAHRLDETMRRINSTLSPENLAAITETLDHLRSLTRNADGVMARLDGTLVSIGHAADGVHTATASLSGDVHRLADRYDTLGAETTTSIRDVSVAVKQVSADVSQLSRRTESLLVDTDAEVRLTGQQLRGSTDALGVAARKFRDPRATLFGPGAGSLGPGEDRR